MKRNSKEILSKDSYLRSLNDDALCKKLLIEALHEKAKRDKKPPNEQDIKNDPTMPSVKYYKKYFGGIMNARIIAGYTPYNACESKWTAEDVYKSIKCVAKILNKEAGYAPTSDEYVENYKLGEMPSYSCIANICGSYTDAVIGANLKLSVRKTPAIVAKKWTPEDVYRGLNAVAKALGKKAGIAPTINEYRENYDPEKMPNVYYIKKVCGSYKKAVVGAKLQLAWMEKSLTVKKKWTPKDARRGLNAVAKALGKKEGVAPTAREYRENYKHGEMPSYSCIVQIYGNYTNAVADAHLRSLEKTKALE